MNAKVMSGQKTAVTGENSGSLAEKVIKWGIENQHLAGNIYDDKILDIAIKEAKKEVFDDIDSWATKFYGKNWYDDNALGDIKALRRLRQRHLSTFPNKEKEHNSSSKKDCYNTNCDSNVEGKMCYSQSYFNKCNKDKSSPS